MEYPPDTKKTQPRVALNLSALQPGDVLLTRGTGFVSSLVAIGQRLLHWQLSGPIFTHAALLVSPFLKFETTPERGARFRRIQPSAISYEHSSLQLWWELQGVENAAVIRYPTPSNDIGPADWLAAAATLNIEDYPGLHGFASLLSKLRLVANWIGVGGAFEYDAQAAKFCSALVVELQQRLDRYPHRSRTAGEVSPQMLYDAAYVVPNAIRLRRDISLESGAGADHYVVMSKLTGGAGGPFDFDSFMHGMEDMQAAFNKFSRGMLKNNRSPEIERLLGPADLVSDPRLTQHQALLDTIRGGERILAELQSCSECYQHCSDCDRPTDCSKTLNARMRTDHPEFCK